MNLFYFPSAFKAIFTNLHAISGYSPTTLGSYYTGQDHDEQVTLFSGIQQWTVPYTGDYRIEAVGAAGGYDKHPNSLQYRGRGARTSGGDTLPQSIILINQSDSEVKLKQIDNRQNLYSLRDLL